MESIGHNYWVRGDTYCAYHKDQQFQSALYNKNVGNKQRKTVNFKLGEEVRKDRTFNMSQVWDKDDILLSSNFLHIIIVVTIKINFDHQHRIHDLVLTWTHSHYTPCPVNICHS